MRLPENRNYKEFYFGRDNDQNKQQESRMYTVEGDWSGAAFLLVAGAVAGETEVQGIFNTSAQADKKIVDA